MRLSCILEIVVFNLLLMTLANATPIIVEGEHCDRNTFVQTCDGNTLFRCSGDQGVIAHDCSRLNKICVDFGSNSERFLYAADCIEIDDDCETEGEVVTKERTLTSGNSIERTMQCEKSTDGKLYYRLLRPKYYPTNIEKHEQREQLNAEAKKQRAEAVENKKAEIEKRKAVIAKHENETCDPDTYVSSCDDDIILRCGRDKLVKAHTCPGFDRTCVDFGANSEKFLFSAECLKETEKCQTAGEIVVLEEKPRKVVQCEKATSGELYYRQLHPMYDPANADKLPRFEEMQKKREMAKAEAEKQKGNHAGEACKTENALTEICEISSSGRSIVIAYRCIKNTAGKLELVKDSASACDNGAGTCSPKGQCLPGKTCNAAKFKPSCNGNDAINCIDGKEHHTICSKDQTCSVADGEAKCAKAVKKSVIMKSTEIKKGKKASKKGDVTSNSALINRPL